MRAVQKTYKVFNYDFGEGWNVCKAEAKMPSEKFNWDSPDFMPIRRVEFINSDRHGCDQLTIVKITALTEAECDDEIEGQISDGAFENCRVGEWYPTETKTVYIKNKDRLTPKHIIENIESNGGLDLNNLRRCARADRKAFTSDYIANMVKSWFNCHLSTAKAVARHFYY